MKKIKTLIVALILTLVILQTACVNGYIVENKKTEEIEISYQKFNDDGTIENNKIKINKKEASLFESIISKIIEMITTNRNFNLDEIFDDLENQFGTNRLLSMITSINGITPKRKSAFIVSEGYGSKIGLLSRSEIKFSKSYNFWLYQRNNNPTKNSMTLTFNLIPNRDLQFTKLIQGWQIGFMSGFKGLYIKMPGSLLQNKDSHTFFVGYASRINIIDLPNPINIK